MVYYEDTDAAGIVYYANYLKFAERARTELLRLLGFGQEKLRAEHGLAFAVRRCLADYRGAARLDDELVVESRLTALGGASLEVEPWVRRGGEGLVRLDVKLACLGRDLRPARMPPPIRAALAELMQPSRSEMT
jgi:acyl-CoA thioester hydrolase